MKVRKHASKESTLALKPKLDVTRSPIRGINSSTKRTRKLQKLKTKIHFCKKIFVDYYPHEVHILDC